MNDIKKTLSNHHVPIATLLGISLIIGFFIVRDYGVGWDEPDIYQYSNYAIGAYSSILHPGQLQDYPDNLNLYGPAYFMLANLLGRFLVSVIPAWSSIDAWHFVYYLTFLSGVLSLYLLANRWMSKWAAFGASLLFLTQPLLWGHAFMNPKDTPFMTFFMLSIYLGLCMADAPVQSMAKAALTIFAGIVLGFTISFRVIGPLAGLFVIAYAWINDRRRVWGYLIPYLITAGATTYLTWPYLWKAPIANFIESFRTMANFPATGNLLFWGELYKPDQLPWYYFPTIFGLQLTEPLLLFSLIGLVVLIVSIPKKEKLEPAALLAGWFLIPVITIFATHASLYDNARQLFFLLPPILFVAGLGMDLIFRNSPAVFPKVLLMMIIALPGLYSMIRLHPYEYVYYNSLVGGTGGAFREFEMDYWGISFKDATEYLNTVAPQGANVRIFGPINLVQPYAKPDLHLIEDISTTGNFDYAIIPTRSNRDLHACQDADKIIFAVGRMGAIFSEVVKLTPGEQCK